MKQGISDGNKLTSRGGYTNVKAKSSSVNLTGRKRTARFEETAIPHLAEVYRLARQMTDERQSQDIAQETFLRAWKYFDSFEEGTNCRSWLFRILHNVWTDQWHKTRLESPLTEKEEATIEPYYDWEDEFLKGELSPEFEQTLARVPEMYRWAILLADVEELSYQEIARVMSCPIGTVMSRINRGRRSLARLIRSSVTDDTKKKYQVDEEKEERHKWTAKNSARF